MYFAALVLGLATILAWALPLTSSFWLDECGTVWLTTQGLETFWYASREFPHGPGFALLEIAFAQLPLPREIALRAPSWVAALIASVLFHRLAGRLLPAAAAFAASSVFLTWPLVGYAASDARPYALALALTCGLLYDMVDCLDPQSPRKPYWRAGVLLAALAYTQLLFAYAAAPVACIVLFDAARRRVLPDRNWLKTAAAALVLIAPLSGHYLALLQQGSSFRFLDRPGLLEIVGYMVPQNPLLLFLGAAILATPLATGAATSLSKEDWRALAFLLPAALTPILVITGLSYVGPASLFVPRYLTPSVPGLALGWGWVISRIQPERYVYAVSLLSMAASLVLFLTFRSEEHAGENWQSAAARANQLLRADSTHEGGGA